MRPYLIFLCVAAAFCGAAAGASQQQVVDWEEDITDPALLESLENSPTCQQVSRNLSQYRGKSVTWAAEWKPALTAQTGRGREVFYHCIPLDNPQAAASNVFIASINGDAARAPGYLDALARRSGKVVITGRIDGPAAGTPLDRAGKLELVTAYGRVAVSSFDVPVLTDCTVTPLENSQASTIAAGAPANAPVPPEEARKDKQGYRNGKQLQRDGCKCGLK